jgi:hypothetical protein
VRLFPCEPSGLPENNPTRLPEDIKKTKYNSKYRLKAKKMAGAFHPFRHMDKSVQRMDQSVFFLGV